MSKVQKYSKKISRGKFVFLSFITLGIYDLIWFYRMWVFIRDKKNLDIWPFWRAVFSPLFAGSCAGHLKEIFNEKEVVAVYSPLAIGLGYFFLSALHRLPDPFWLVSFLSVFVILPVVGAVNSYSEKEESDLPVREFAWWQIIFVLFGLMFFILVVIGAFIPE